MCQGPCLRLFEHLVFFWTRLGCIELLESSAEDIRRLIRWWFYILCDKQNDGIFSCNAVISLLHQAFESWDGDVNASNDIWTWNDFSFRTIIISKLWLFFNNKSDIYWLNLAIGLCMPSLSAFVDFQSYYWLDFSLKNFCFICVTLKCRYVLRQQ